MSLAALPPGGHGLHRRPGGQLCCRLCSHGQVSNREAGKKEKAREGKRERERMFVVVVLASVDNALQYIETLLITHNTVLGLD